MQHYDNHLRLDSKFYLFVFVCLLDQKSLYPNKMGINNELYTKSRTLSIAE